MARRAEPWHLYAADKVEYRLKTNQSVGLEPRECRDRLAYFGHNTLFLPPPCGKWKILSQFLTDPGILLLLLICTVSLLFGRYAASVCVLTVLAISTVIHTMLVYRSERIHNAMASYSAPRVRTLRGGQLLLADCFNLVPGDVLLLREGDVVPCDCRIVEATESLVVMSYRLDSKGRVQYEPQIKNALTVEENQLSDEYENMMYAGSFVQTGEAKVIAVATGKETQIGKVGGPHALCKDPGNPQSLTLVRKYLNRYSLILSIAVLPVTIGAFFAARGSLDLLDVVLLALSLVIASMNEQLLSMGKTICSGAVLRASYGSAKKDTVILKQFSVADTLNTVSRVFLFDRAAVFDGIPHVESLYTADAVYQKDDKNIANERPVLHLAETAYRFESGLAQYRRTMRALAQPQWPSLYAGVYEFCQDVGFDIDSSDARKESIRCIRDGQDCEVAEVTLNRVDPKTGQKTVYCIHRVRNEAWLDHCSLYLKDNISQTMTEEAKTRLKQAAVALRAEGMQVYLYFLEQHGTRTFEGMLAFSEHFDKKLKQRRKALADAGIQTSLFLDDTSPAVVRELLRAGWMENETRVLRAGEGKIEEHIDDCSVFLGFTDDDILNLYAFCRKENIRTASFGMLHTSAPRMNPASVCFTCENRQYSSDAPYAEEYVVLDDPQQANEGAECAQSVRQNADALILHAEQDGGGLVCIHNAVQTARSFHTRMMLAMQYLLVVQFVRMTVVCIPLFFGIQAMSPALALLSGLWIDIGFLLCFALHHCSSETLKKPLQYTRFFTSPLKTRPDWIVAAVIAGICTAVVGIVGAKTGTVQPGIFFFLAMFYLQLSLLFCLLRCTGRIREMAVWLVILLVTVTVVLLLVIGPLAEVLGCLGTQWLSYLLPLVSPLFLLVAYFLSCRYRKPFLRFIVSRVRGLLYGRG